MGQGVEVDVVAGHGQRVGPDLGRDDLGVAEVGGGGGGRGELGRELAEGQVLAPALDEAEGGGVPEAGGAPVAEHHLVAVGQGEQRGQPGPQAAHHRLDRLLAVAGPEVGARGGGQGLHGLGADLGGPGAEPPVGGQEVGGDADVGGVGHVWNHGTHGPADRNRHRGAPGRRRDRQPHLGPDRRRLAVGHAGRRRQGQGPPGPGGERHRLRGRRARLPDARRRRGRGRGGLPRPPEPPLHADRRPARAARGHRRQDRAATRASRWPPPRCW